MLWEAEGERSKDFPDLPPPPLCSILMNPIPSLAVNFLYPLSVPFLLKTTQVPQNPLAPPINMTNPLSLRVKFK